MSYKLQKSTAILTRAASPITYNPFTQMVDVSGKITGVPVPKGGQIILHRASLMFDWVVTVGSLTCRMRYLDDDPTSPPLTLVDNADGGSFSLTNYGNTLTSPPDLAVVPINGLSYGSINYTSNPFYLNSKSGSINVFLFQTNGHDAPASGRIKISLYYQIISAN